MLLRMWMPTCWPGCTPTDLQMVGEPIRPALELRVAAPLNPSRIGTRGIRRSEDQRHAVGDRVRDRLVQIGNIERHAWFLTSHEQQRAQEIVREANTYPVAAESKLLPSNHLPALTGVGTTLGKWTHRVPGTSSVTVTRLPTRWWAARTGAGPRRRDVILFLEVAQHPDLLWTDPHIHYLLERATTFARIMYLQRRGVGLSDPVDHVPTLEQQADDVLAVMDAVGIRHAPPSWASAAPAAPCVDRGPVTRAGPAVVFQPFVEGPLATARMPGLGRGVPGPLRRRVARTVYEWGTGGSSPGGIRRWTRRTIGV